MNFYIASLLWFVGSAIITTISDHFTGYNEDSKERPYLNCFVHKIMYQFSGAALMYIFIYFH